jgi:hypothetical protein
MYCKTHMDDLQPTCVRCCPVPGYGTHPLGMDSRLDKGNFSFVSKRIISRKYRSLQCDFRPVLIIVVVLFLHT